MALAESSSLVARPARVHAWFRSPSLLTALSAFALVVLGGVVRVTGSGLGCPDWPLCHGGILPPLELTAIIEYTHRVVASALVGPLVLATSITAWIAYRREPWLVIPATLALLMLVGQALLGGVTVLKELPGPIVAAHLALGEALLACLVLIAVVAWRGPLAGPGHRSGGNPGAGQADPFPALALLSGAGVYILLLSGSYVTAAGATGACLDWPLCHGGSFGSGPLQAIHMGHRFVAAVIGALLVYTLYLGFRRKHRPREIRSLSVGVAALFLAQVAVGAATVLLGFPTEFMALHLALATAVWGTVVALACLSLARPALASKEPTYA